jgi:lipopolysaccharide transport system ATP-binding protein
MVGRRCPDGAMTEAVLPTVFHITHWKAGSQWIAEILKHCAPQRFIPWTLAEPDARWGHGTPAFYIHPLQPGMVYGTVYVPRDRFYAVATGWFWRSPVRTFIFPRRMLLNWWNFRIRRLALRPFLLVRDLRDTLISFYFSIRNSHELIPAVNARRRQALEQLSPEDGLLYLMEETVLPCALIQDTWLRAAGVLQLRYESILGNELPFFEALVDYCQISVDRPRLREIVQYNTFEAATGRRRGEEDVRAHLRKGIAGDWKNYFTPRVKQEFKRRFGELLIRAGYESDSNW